MRHGGHILKCPTIKTDDVGNIYFFQKIELFFAKNQIAANYIEQSKKDFNDFSSNNSMNLEFTQNFFFNVRCVDLFLGSGFNPRIE